MYDPESGFYSRAGGPSRRRDFLTSPGLGPLFGAVVARALDTWWRDLGAPEPFHVIEAGAGDGALAKAILGSGPDCRPALRYVAVETATVLRLLHPPEVTSLAEMPAGALEGVVVANELLDNLPFRLLQRAPDGWAELFVDEEGHEVLAPARPEAAAGADWLAPGAPPGTRIPLQDQAANWLRAALATLSRGRVVVIDYADTTPNLATRHWTEWVRTYRANGPGAPPLEAVGEQDITCEVALDQLASVRPPTVDRSQAEFLRAHGLDELAAEARQSWQQQAHVGDLTALKHKSRLTEAAALTDPQGLGAFRVLEWVVSE
ncbi:MAG: SAM-dependent methyltransferase [Actinomycetota bacterium]|nr:SAM-dependent methyltransferase [Actinomycetota bacterium]